MNAYNLDHIPSQKGRLAVVTGANVGLGYEIALALAKKDFEVVLACRNLQRAQRACETIVAAYPHAKLKCLEIDLSKQGSVHAFVRQFHHHYDQVDLLINNAGLMMTPYKITEDGFEEQLATNYLGHFKLTSLLLKTLEKTQGSRIVMVSSLSHKWINFRFDDPHFKQGYNRRSAYGQSKLACLMFAYELDRRLKGLGFQTRSLAAHPGLTITNIMRHINPISRQLVKTIIPWMTEKTEKAALPILRAALDPEVMGGEYYGLSGWREYKGSAVPVNSNKFSKNPQHLDRLFELSQNLTGTKFF